MSHDNLSHLFWPGPHLDQQLTFKGASQNGNESLLDVEECVHTPELGESQTRLTD